jgi:acyl-homoserine lactone acylase PvdQ
VSLDEAFQYALDIRPYGVDVWLNILREVSEKQKNLDPKSAGAEALNDLLSWDGELRADSTGALKYYHWREQVSRAEAEGKLENLRSRVDNYMLPLGEDREVFNPNRAESAVLFQSFLDAIVQIEKDFDDINQPWGAVFRIAHDDSSWPVEGGGSHGTSTLRSIGYGRKQEDGTRLGIAGQVATQLVVLEKPIRSWSASPFGQSDRPDSPHYNDQAKKLFSLRKLKSSWWTPEELQDHIESREVIQY